MKLDTEQVKERFHLYSGEDPDGEGQRAELCAQLCGECAEKAGALLGNRRERDDDPEAEERCLSALESWAAAEAFYQLVLTDEALSPESVSADGVQIKDGERSRKAKALAEEKRRAAFAALGEGAFYFGQV